MRQAIIFLSLLGSFTVFALTVQLFDILVMFLLFGILPGQATPLSANQMLVIYSAATGFVTLYALRGSIATFLKLLRTKSQSTSRAT